MENGSFSHLTKGRRILLPWEMRCGGWYCKITCFCPSLSSWLEEDDDPVVAKVNQRMQQITGLTVKTAELLQVANYGMGGQYEPHFDFSRVRSHLQFFLSRVGRREPLGLGELLKLFFVRAFNM